MQLECFAAISHLMPEMTQFPVYHTVYIQECKRIYSIHSFTECLLSVTMCNVLGQKQTKTNKSKFPLLPFPTGIMASIKELCIVPNILMNFKPLTHTHSHALSSLCTNNNKIGHTHILQFYILYIFQFQNLYLLFAGDFAQPLILGLSYWKPNT